MLSRRRFVTGSAALVAAVAAARRPASAISVEVAPKSVEEAYHAACGDAVAYHARVVAEAREVLDQTRLTEAEKAEILRGLNCPICRCEIGTS